ncbi:MAG: GNAT family N-acetyltransferase [Saprospiraceae bacterium]|nr:GNAT family N-acetyltransferase [Saprospiraceae bacterium]
MINIKTYEPKYGDPVVALILNIQQNEFQVPVTLADQPDLLAIDSFYQQRNGEFWVAVNEQDEVVGTIALIDNGEIFGTIRKMFVRADYRGKERGVAASLFKHLEQKAIENQMIALYLGTVDRLKASHRFYEKNGFSQIPKQDLPHNYPLMQVDTMFFKKELSTKK